MVELVVELVVELLVELVIVDVAVDVIALVIVAALGNGNDTVALIDTVDARGSTNLVQ